MVLAASLALSWAVVQLLVAVAAPVFAELTGRRSIAGVGPAIALAFWPSGRCWSAATWMCGDALAEFASVLRGPRLVI